LPQSKGRRIIDHASEHCSNFSAFLNQDLMLCLRQIQAVTGEIEPSFGFSILVIRVRQFTHEVGLVFPLCLCFPQIRTDRARRTSDLIGQYFSSAGNFLLASKISIASAYAF
jgi:hypothetical protein